MDRAFGCGKGLGGNRRDGCRGRRRGLGPQCNRSRAPCWRRRGRRNRCWTAAGYACRCLCRYRRNTPRRGYARRDRGDCWGCGLRRQAKHGGAPGRQYRRRRGRRCRRWRRRDGCGWARRHPDCSDRGCLIALVSLAIVLRRSRCRGKNSQHRRRGREHPRQNEAHFRFSPILARIFYGATGRDQLADREFLSSALLRAIGGGRRARFSPCRGLPRRRRKSFGQ